jgi:prephenate dehydrogenase
VTAISRVAIIGVGLIGGSLGLALRQRRQDLTVSGITMSPEEAEAALRRGAVSSASTDLDDAGQADLIVVATPLDVTRSVLAHLDDVAPRGLITDTGSVKAEIVRWAAELVADPDRFLGSHPMAGKTDSGLTAADPGLFHGAAWVFTPREGQDIARFDGWFECLRALGARPVIMDATEHDRRVAIVSHLAFLLSSAYVTAVRASDEPERTAALAGPGFRDMIRLATGDARMYAAIIEHNREPIRAAVERLESSLAEYRRLLTGDDAAAGALFEASREVARGWLRA